MTGIHHVRYLAFGERCIETGPSRARFKFCVRAEQLVSTRSTEIDPFLMIVPILILVGRFRFCFAQHLKLSRSQNRPPLIIAQRDLLRHRSGLDLAPDSRDFCVPRGAEARRQDAEEEKE